MCPSDGQSSRDEEEDRGPDSSSKGEAVVGDQASNFDDEGNEPADNVDNAKSCRMQPSVVLISEAHILHGCLEGVDHLVGGILLIFLLHF